MKPADCHPRGLWRLATITIVLAASQPLPAGTRTGLDYMVEDYDVEGLLEAAETGTPFYLSMGDTACWIQVSPRVLRSERFRATAIDRDGYRPVIPAAALIFRGEVVGEPGSVVRLSFNEAGLSAFVKRGDDVRFIEPLDEPPAPGMGAARLLRAHKTVRGGEQILDFDGTCGTLSLSENLFRRPLESVTLEALPTSERVFREPGELIVMQIAVDADYEYFLRHPENAAASIEETLNVVEGIYEAELGILFEITTVNVYEADVDPYTVTVAEDLLAELQFHWNTEKVGVLRDVVHLFTGRELQGSTVGIAFVAEVCDLSGAYGISQDLRDGTLMSLLVAHEIAHNLGATHDVSSPSAPKYIMSSSLSKSTLQEFSDKSKQEIEAYVGPVTCLEVQPAAGGGGGGGGGGSDPVQSSAGGGGGPVDPLTLLLAVLAGIATLRRQGRNARTG